MNNQTELNRHQERLLDALALRSTFWGAVRAKYAEYGALTARQFELFERDAAQIAWQHDAQRVAGLPVRNKFQVKAVGKTRPRCARRPFCTAAATVVVGSWAYCEDHGDAAREERDEWLRARAEERAQERAAEATGT